MKLRRIINKVIIGVLSFSIGALFGLLTIDRFSSTPPPEVEPIAGDYIAWYFGSSMSAIHNTKKKMDIPPKVIGYKTNGKYITIRQHPDMPQNAIYKHVDYPEYNPDNHYYWIIDLHRDSIVEGPVDYQSFKDRCALLHIEDSLTLFKQ